MAINLASSSTVTSWDIGTGQTYTTLQGWDTAQNGDLVTGSKIYNARVLNETITGNLSLYGWTTNSDCYVIIESDPDTPAAYHGGVVGGGAVCTSSQTGTTRYLEIKHDALIRNLEFNSAGTSAAPLLNVGPYEAVDVRIENCIIKSTNTAGNGNKCIYVGEGGSYASYVEIYQCLLLDAYDSSLHVNGAAATGVVKNSLAINGNRRLNTFRGGFVRNAQTTYTNCVAFNCYDSDFYGSGGTLSYCASGDTTADGTGAVTGVVAGDFLDEANDDYHLAAASSALESAGTSASEFTTDIDGDTWTDWAIGWDQLVGGGGGLVIPIAVYHYNHNIGSN